MKTLNKPTFQLLYKTQMGGKVYQKNYPNGEVVLLVIWATTIGLYKKFRQDSPIKPIYAQAKMERNQEGMNRFYS
jgi:hypothetical protein